MGEEVSDTHREMARMTHQGISDKDIASKLHLSAAQLTGEWDALSASLKGVSREDAVSLILAQLVIEARAALDASQSELALIVCAPEDRAVVTLNSLGIITGISPHCETLLGVPCKRLVGMPVDILLRGRADEVETSSHEMDKAGHGDHVKAERVHLRPDGTSFIAEHSLVAILGDEGHVTGFVRQITDLTRRRVHQVKIDELDATLALLVHE